LLNENFAKEIMHLKIHALESPPSPSYWLYDLFRGWVRCSGVRQGCALLNEKFALEYYAFNNSHFGISTPTFLLDL
jgi:hypothetical protein